MDAEVYPDARVIEFIEENLLPLKIHIKENPEGFHRFDVQWTPTVLIADPGGVERYRFEGYLPVDEFLPQLSFGVGKSEFAAGNWKEAEQRFRGVVARHAGAAVAPEALYRAGVSKYKATNDGAALAETAAALHSQYPDSVWAKKASVWAASAA